MAKTMCCHTCGETIKYGTKVCPECGQSFIKNKSKKHKMDKYEIAKGFFFDTEEELKKQA